jgi:hypothetical protein
MGQTHAIYRCDYQGGRVAELLTAPSADGQADIARYGYEVVASNVDLPVINTVIRVQTPQGAEHFCANFEPGTLSVLLHPEAVTGRLLNEVKGDERLDWTGVRPRVREGVVVGVEEAHRGLMSAA